MMWWLVAIISLIIGGITSCIALVKDKENWDNGFMTGCVLAFLIGLGYFFLLAQ